MKRKILSIIAVILSLILLVSCGKTTDKDSGKTSKPSVDSGTSSSADDTDDDVDDTEIVEDVDDIELEISEDELAEDILFATTDVSTPIIYPASADDNIVRSARIMYEKMKNTYADEDVVSDEGTYPKTVSGLIKDVQNGVYRKESNYVQDKEETDQEILIGATNRAASDTAVELLNKRENNVNDFVISVSNSDLAIVGGSPDALELGVRYFLEKYATGADIMLKEGFYAIYRPDYSLSDAEIAGVKVKDVQIVMPYIKSFIESREAYNLQSLLRNATGHEVKFVDERATRKASEIVIGTANTDAKGNKLADKSYAIFVKDGKIYINGADETTLAFAVNKFNSVVESAIKGNKKSFADKNVAMTGKATESKSLYKLTWNDEFDGTTYDSYLTNFGYRSYQVANQTTIGGYTASSTTYNQDTFGANVHYSTDQRCMRVENGKLVLEGHKIDDKTFVMPADLRSEGYFTFDYGYIEAKVKIPYGPGTFPSFWLSGNMEKYSTSYEIDIFETMGISDVMQMDAFLWGKNKENEYAADAWVSKDIRPYYPHNVFYYLPKGETFYERFHTVGCEKTPEYIAIYYDGSLVGKYDTTTASIGEWDLMNQFMQVAFSMPVNRWTEVDDTSIMKFEIDYVRLYQLDGIGSIAKKLQ